MGLLVASGLAFLQVVGVARFHWAWLILPVGIDLCYLALFWSVFVWIRPPQKGIR